MLRVGIGYDAHKLVRGRALMLGGVKVPHTKGLEGHSDADVILHAVVDSILGAAGLPDIGSHFSNKDPRWKNVSSLLFLEETRRILARKKMRVQQLDAVLIADAPMLAKYIPEMKAKIARAENPGFSVGESVHERRNGIHRTQGRHGQLCCGDGETVIAIKFHSTLTGRKEVLNRPNPAKCGCVCGITPYDETHLGHARCYVLFDTVRRFFKSAGYAVRFVEFYRY